MYKFLVGLLFGFFIGVIIMNVPDIMKNSGTYRKLQRQTAIEWRR